MIQYMYIADYDIASKADSETDKMDEGEPGPPLT